MNDDLVRVAPADARRPARAASTARLVLPSLIVDAGPVAVARFLEFFAARIANARTRAAYGRAVGQFLAWCEARGLGLQAVSPLHVAAYIRTHPGSAPTVKQHLGERLQELAHRPRDRDTIALAIPRRDVPDREASPSRYRCRRGCAWHQ